MSERDYFKNKPHGVGVHPQVVQYDGVKKQVTVFPLSPTISLPKPSSETLC